MAWIPSRTIGRVRRELGLHARLANLCWQARKGMNVSEDPNQPTSPQPSQSSAPEDPLRRLRHDLRHVLYVFDLAFRLLEESRDDPQRFDEILQMLRKERQNLDELLDELLQAAGGKPGAFNAPSPQS